MNIHEFGKENRETVLLLHPSAVRWDYFRGAVPLLQEKYRLLIPAIPGYDPDQAGDFTSVEQVAADLNLLLKRGGYTELYAVYGCSMGGSVALLTALGQKVRIRHCVMDGGITPYQLPWIATRLIAVRDYLMVMAGRAGGAALLEKAFAADEYSGEDLEYVSGVLRQCSRKTIWRTFDSCNNYRVPDPVPAMDTRIHYWYAEGEKKEREWDVAYMKRKFPQTEFEVLPGLGHGGLVIRKPALFAEKISALR